MDNKKKVYTFLWFIENYSFCWHKNGENLVSPDFIADGLENTVWNLHLYPRGIKGVNDYLGLFLYRREVGGGSEKFELDYNFSILGKDSAVIHTVKYKNTFEVGYNYGSREFILVDDVLRRRKVEYLPQDILSVRCQIWKGEGSIHNIGQSTARTRIGIEKISFLQKLKSFSALETNQKKTLQLPCRSTTDCIISSSVHLTDCTCHDEKVMVEIMSSLSNYILFKLKLYLVDGSGNNTECGEIHRFDAVSKDIQKVPISLTKQEILSRESKFLPNGELSLLCECVFTTGVELEKLEEIRYVLPLAPLKQNVYNLPNKDVYHTAEKLSTCSSALEDLKTIYDNQCFTDVELKTKTKSFQAHKLVLCARSSVFKAMLTNDMMEKNTASIKVDDLENETLHQLLLFLYADQLENLEWESAIKLYYAGDKYAVEKLKVLCSSFLVNNISTATAVEVLQLADTHNDSDLKNFMEDFILEHEEEVFGSDEWEKLIDINPQLVIKTMHLKYKRKKGGK